MARPKPVYLSIRLYTGQDDDLIAWLESLDALPPGMKAHTVRAALRRALAGAPAPAAPLDLEALGDALERRLRVVLADLKLQPTPAPAGEAVEWFDDFAALMIDEGEEDDHAQDRD